MSIKMISGFGQFHSNEVTAKKRQEYIGIDLVGIRALVDHPQEVDKPQAQWLIPSSLPSREFKQQEQHGKFWMLWADLDKSPLAIDTLKDAVDSLGFFDYEIYASRSATSDNQKARLLIPLNQPLSGANWQLCQEVLNDKLNALGATPDHANLGCGQLCYLPNRGEFYASRHSRNGNLFNPLIEWSDEITAKRQAVIKQAEVVNAAKIEAQARRASIGERSYASLISAFNDAYDVASILIQARYDQRGNQFRHPNSESGSYSASVKDGRVHSLSSSDPLYTDGGGVGAHDAFSAFKVLFADGNETRALKLAGDEWLTIKGESWNKVQQRKYQQSQEVISDDCLPILNQNQPFSLNQFALNGSSQQLREKMLDDKFILGRLAILGQSTIFYAQPNAGKTLLTIWLLSKAIESGDIAAEDVFYINADDNFKGLVTKLAIAESYGFNMLAPGHYGFQPSSFAAYIMKMIQDNATRGKVIILDTAKKFTDIMDKKVSTEFGKVIRQFVMHGGSVIMLAHVNKHRDSDGKLIFAGTSDFVDDMDCVYLLDVIKKTASNEITVLFENKKSRGDNTQTASYCYQRIEGQGYNGLLATVREASKDDVGQAKKEAAIEEALQRNHEAINAILDSMADGIFLKTEIINDASERSVASKQTIKKVLIQHTGENFIAGHRWTLTIDKADNNAHIYKPLLSVKKPAPPVCSSEKEYSALSNGE